MRKNYIKPATKIIEVSTEAALLNASGIVNDNTNQVIEQSEGEDWAD